MDDGSTAHPGTSLAHAVAAPRVLLWAVVGVPVVATGAHPGRGSGAVAAQQWCPLGDRADTGAAASHAVHDARPAVPRKRRAVVDVTDQPLPDDTDVFRAFLEAREPMPLDRVPSTTLTATDIIRMAEQRGWRYRWCRRGRP